jgi:transglutaminase-like putative cysteine protease
MAMRCFRLPFSVPLLVAAGMFLWVPRAAAGVGFQPVSQEELKMTADPLAPGANAIILFREVDRDDNRNTPHQDNYVRIKILTEEGRKFGNIEIPFAKGIDDVVGLHARTIRPDGSIVNFEGKVEETTLRKGQGARLFAKTLALPDVQPGGIVEYYFTYDYRQHEIHESHWILSSDLFTRSARFLLKPYHSDFNYYRPRWIWHDLPPGTEPKEGPDHVVRMEASNIPAFQSEDFMPPPDELKARVDFIYEEELGDPNPERYWKEIGKKWNGKLESFVGKHKAMDEAVAQIVAPNDAPEVKLHKIYERVQQVRNTFYEPRKTEEEKKRDKEKADENVEDVWKRGYGDRWQIAWLYLALARAAGFEAYGCWLSDRRNYFFTPKTMIARRLDTNVVLVKLNGKDVYLDPGTAYAPFGTLTWFKTGVQGLRLDKDGGEWIRTTLPPSSESRAERKAQLKLEENGDLEGKVTVTYMGLEAAYHRQDVRNEDDVARKRFLENRLKALVPSAAEVELTNQPDWKNTETPLVAEFSLKVPGWASRAGKRALLPAGVFTNGEKHIFEHANRVHPIYYEYPFEKFEDVTIEFPPGWQVSSMPAPKTEDQHVITYNRKIENDKNTLHLTRKMSVDVLLLDQKYYGALRNFYQAVRTADEEQIVLLASAGAGN